MMFRSNSVEGQASFSNERYLFFTVQKCQKHSILNQTYIFFLNDPVETIIIRCKILFCIKHRSIDESQQEILEFATQFTDLMHVPRFDDGCLQMVEQVRNFFLLCAFQTVFS
jgi:hypothetical protein